MSARKYGWQVEHNGLWLTARGIGTWEAWQAEAERQGSRRVRVTCTRDGLPSVAWEGPADEMPQVEPA